MILLIQKVQAACQIEILNPDISIKVKEEERKDKLRFKLKDSRLRVYTTNVKFEEVMSSVVTDLKNVKK